MDIYDFLADERIDEINSNIPDINKWIKRDVLGTSVRDLLNDTKISDALGCLDDARNRFSFIRTALFEAQAKMIWFLEISPDAPDESQAIANGKFFLDYVTLLLYAISEDISFFISYYFNLNITEYVKKPEIQKILGKENISSNASKVALYLRREMKSNKITELVSNLHNDPNWDKALKYRNEWVHKKPPIISGLGDKFPRKMHRITTNQNGTRDLIVLAGVPQYSIDELLSVTLNATQVLANTLSEIIEMVVSDNQK
jgi:hypothetical protein